MERVEGSEVQVAVESAQGLKRRIRVSVPAQRIESEVESRLRSVARTANIKGYRPGKVPEKVVRQRFSEQVREEVMQDFVRSSYSEAVSREKLRPVGDAQIETIPDAGEKGGDLSFTASFEIFPEFQLQGIDALSISRPEPQFDDADVQFIIDNLRRQRRNWNAVEREARDGDRVTLDFEGHLDGQPIEGGAGDQVSVIIGAGRLVPDFERQLAGVRASRKPSGLNSRLITPIKHWLAARAISSSASARWPRSNCRRWTMSLSAASGSTVASAPSSSRIFARTWRRNSSRVHELR